MSHKAFYGVSDFSDVIDLIPKGLFQNFFVSCPKIFDVTQKYLDNLSDPVGVGHVRPFKSFI